MANSIALVDGNIISSASLTTTGSSGAATFSGSTLNIPNYSLAGLGGQPTLDGTGYVRMVGTTVSYISGTSAQFLMADGSVSTNPGWITSYTETDTLASVTARGASTSTALTLSSTSNYYSGHHYFTAYDGNGNHYPHYLVGDSNNGAKVNLRVYSGNGSTLKLFYLNGQDGAISWDGFTIWHSGNDGSGTGLDADLLDGYNSATGSTANTIALRDSAGDVAAREFVLTASTVHTTTPSAITGIFPTTNQVVKFAASAVQTFLGLGSAAYTASTDYGRAYSAGYSFGGTNVSMSTADFISILTGLGAFSQPYWVARGSWCYACNKYITDTGLGDIHLAGCTVEVIGDATNFTIRIHTPTTSNNGVTNTEFIYVQNSTGYSPGWRKIWNSATLTNLNQLTNGPGYITSYTETDTLASVTARGASTSVNITAPIFVGRLNAINGTSTIIGQVQTTSSINFGIDANNYGYGISTNNAGGLDIMANQASQPVRIYAGSANESPTLSGTFLSGTLSIPTSISIGGNTVWHAGNDGASSGLDADLLDGNHASAFALASHTHTLLSSSGEYVWNESTAASSFSTGLTLSFVRSDEGWFSYGTVINAKGYSSGGGSALQMYVPYSPTYGGTSLKVRFGNYDTSAWTSWKTLWADDNDGSGSGLDADLLDGYHESAFMRYYGFSTSGNFQTFQGTSGRVRFDQVGDIGSGSWSNAPTGIYTYGGVLSYRGDNFGLQIYASHTGGMMYKTQWNDDQYSGWLRILDTQNYNSYAPTLTGTGASGTWGISISGNAATATALTSMNISQFTNNSGYITAAQTYYLGTTQNALNRSSAAQSLTGITSIDGYANNIRSGTITNLNTAWTDLGSSIANGLQIFRYDSNATNNPESLDNANWLMNIYSHPSGGTASYGHQIAGVDSNNIYVRTVSNGSFGSWYKIWTAATLTNLNQLTNGPGYITGYTETDTLASVTGRGASTSTAVTFSGNVKIGAGLSDSAYTRITYPAGGSYVTTTSVITGAIRILLPTQGSAMMMTCTVKVYEYNTNKSFTITFGGHRDSANWYNEFCYLDGGENRGELTVRFGVDNGKDCVWIGETNTSWSYPQVFVTDVQLGYTGYSATWLSGWSVDFVTAFTTVNRTQTAYRKLTPANYNSYAPTLTGTGASGTWGINITGNAATATNADTVDGYHASTSIIGNYIVVRDGNGYIFGNYINTTDDVTSGITNIIVKNGDNYHRSASAATVQSFLGLGSMAYASTGSYLPLAGGTMTGKILTPSVGTGTYDSAIEIRETGYALASQSAWGYSPAITFHWGNVSAVRFGLRSDGLMAIDDAPIALRSWVQAYAPTLTGGNASGTWSINISGNAATATNGRYVYDDGAYSGGAAYREASSMHVYYAYLGRLVYNNGAYSGSGWIEPSDLGVRYANNAGTANGANGNFYIDDNYGNTVVGLYSASRFQGVFAMGDSYKLAADGTSCADHYGLAWSHPNAGGQAANLSSHGLLVQQAGVTMAAISTNIWISGQFIGAGTGLTGTAAGLNIGGNAATATNVAASGITGQTGMWTSATRPGPYRLYRRDDNSDYSVQTSYSADVSGYWSLRGYSGDTYHAGCYVAYSGYATDAGSVDGIDSSRIVYGDGARGKSVDKSNANANTSDSSNPSGFFFGNTTTGMPTTDWWNWINVAGNSWSGGDGYGFQLANSFWGDDLKFRRLQSGTWYSWIQVLTSGNISSYAITSLAGETLQAVMSRGNTSSTYIGLSGGGVFHSSSYHFRTNAGSGVYLGSSNTPPLQAFSEDGGAAFMAFHRSSSYAVNMGLDPDNVMRIGGWSASSNRWQLDMSGNMTVAGDVTAYSDARVKTNIKTVEKALEKTLQLRGVTYTRTDSDDKKTKLGVIAQEILEVIPEVVNQDNDGMYNVSYGNLAGVFIEAIKEQQAQIEDLKKQIQYLVENR